MFEGSFNQQGGLLQPQSSYNQQPIYDQGFDQRFDRQSAALITGSQQSGLSTGFARTSTGSQQQEIFLPPGNRPSAGVSRTSTSSRQSRTSTSSQQPSAFVHVGRQDASVDKFIPGAISPPRSARTSTALPVTATQPQTYGFVKETIVDNLPEYEEVERLEGKSYIDIGIMPGESTMTMERTCGSCGKRFTHTEVNEFKRLVDTGKYTNQQAMDIVGIGGGSDLKRFCCRAIFSTPHYIPTAKVHYNPDLIKGVTTIHNPDPWLKYRGNLLRNPKRGVPIRQVEGELLMEPRRDKPEDHDIIIPPGYRFVDWLRVDNSWSGKQEAIWVPQIVESITPNIERIEVSEELIQLRERVLSESVRTDVPEIYNEWKEEHDLYTIPVLGV